MNFYSAGQPFSFNYVAYDQSPSLDVRFRIYDITDGTSTFVEEVTSTYLAFGAYTGEFEGQQGKVYLIIGLVYTAGIVDQFRSPTADVWHEVGALRLATAYGTYDQNGGLFLRTKIYDCSQDPPTFLQNLNMTLAAFGVYFSIMTGSLGKSYAFGSAVYTDGTYTTVDPNRSASCDSIEALGNTTIIIELVEATLEGQSIDAVLEANSA